MSKGAFFFLSFFLFFFFGGGGGTIYENSSTVDSSNPAKNIYSLMVKVNISEMTSSAKIRARFYGLYQVDELYPTVTRKDWGE